MHIRAAELAADNLGQTVKIEPGDETFVTGRLVKIRHKRVVAGDALETETRLELNVLAIR